MKAQAVSEDFRNGLFFCPLIIIIMSKWVEMEPIAMRKGSLRCLAALLALALLTCLPGRLPAPCAAEEEPSRQGLEVYFFDLGRVDGILIRCDGATCFIDVGYKECAKAVLPWLKALGVEKLDCYIGTHGHADHIEGAPEMICALKPDVVYVPRQMAWRAILSCASKAQEPTVQSTPCQILKRGESFMLGGAEIRCLGPIATRRCEVGGIAENENSLILKLTYGARTFLFTGDTSDGRLREVEKKYPGELRCDVLKNPHHNAHHSAAMLDLVKPCATVICTDNELQPGSEYLRLLKKHKSAVFITGSENDGNVLITSDGQSLDVYCGYPMQSVKLEEVPVLTPGERVQVKGKLKPKKLAKPKRWLNWKSSDPVVATVSGGVITAVSDGTATITATAINGVSDSIDVRVSMTCLELDKSELALKVGEGQVVRVRRIGERKPAEGVTWTSEDVGVAMVAPDGEVIGMGVGETQVVARTDDGEAVACHVVVSEKPVKSVKLNKDKLKLDVGERYALSAELSPSDATDRRLEWASSDESVVTVDDYGNVLAVGRGTAKVGVRAAGGAYDVCKVKVE